MRNEFQPSDIPRDSVYAPAETDPLKAQVAVNADLVAQNRALKLAVRLAHSASVTVAAALAQHQRDVEAWWAVGCHCGIQPDGTRTHKETCPLSAPPAAGTGGEAVMTDESGPIPEDPMTAAELEKLRAPEVERWRRRSEVLHANSEILKGQLNETRSALDKLRHRVLVELGEKW